jgi:hypothetical protein
MTDNMDWLILGDFNFIRKPSNRNKPSGDINGMLFFNEAISNLGATCSKLHYLKDWTGSSLLPLGQALIHPHWFFLLLSPLLIMCLVSFLLELLSPRQESSGLKIIGYNIVTSRKL